MAYRTDSTTGPGSVSPHSKVELTISCKNLADKDVFSKSDPMCVLFHKPSRASPYVELERTEVIKDSLNPVFKHKFIVDYFFEEAQDFKFQVYDSDSKSSNLKNHEFLGEVQCRLSEIIGKGTYVANLKSTGSYKKSTISIRSQEVPNTNDKALIQFSANNLDKKDFLGKSDPYFILHRENLDRSYTVVHKSEVIQNNLNPTWRAFQIPVQSLALKNGDANLKIEIYDWDRDSKDDLIGIFSTTFSKLSSGPDQQNIYEVINPKKKANKKSYKNSGTLKVIQYQQIHEPSFLDFIQGGLQINLIIAIDFTQSNGDPKKPSSLHYYNQSKHSQYGLALYAVGEILQDYDYDKRFPGLGFGGLLPNQQVSHCFHLNANPSDPECSGIQGVMQAYYSSLQTVALYGPTNFAPCINYTAKRVRESSQTENYTILLIITDGVITDFDETVRCIIDASNLPLSIIVVGVGRADFSAMEALDADKRRLSSGGRSASRDIVQFVPFQSILDEYANNAETVRAELAKCVLAEVPGQVLSYMKMKNFKPKVRMSFRGQPGGPEPQGPPLSSNLPGQNPCPTAGPIPGAPNPRPTAGQNPYPNTTHVPGAPVGRSASNTNPDQASYPNAGAMNFNQRAGQAPAAPYPNAAPAAPYPNSTPAAPYPNSTPAAPYPNSTPAAPYPNSTPAAPYPSQGQAFYPGQSPYPNQGQVPYPGQSPNVTQGLNNSNNQNIGPYPSFNQPVNPGQSHYPSGGPMAPTGASPYPNPSNSTPYPPVGNQPQSQQQYPSGGQSPYPNQS